MRRAAVSVLTAAVLAACGAGSTSDTAGTADDVRSSTDRADGPAAPDRATPADRPGAPDGPDGSSGQDDPDVGPGPAANEAGTVPPLIVEGWDQVGFVQAVGGDVKHVTNVLLVDGGAVVAASYYEEETAAVAWAATSNLDWTVEPLEGAGQVKDLVSLSDGTWLATGSSTGRDQAIVWRRPAGTGTWEHAGVGTLPTREATTGWDLQVLADGSVLLATDSLTNDPALPHPSVHRSTDGGASWEPVGSLPGLGVLAMAQLPDGTVLAATEESEEHDDPDAAGQARVFRSSDGGETWDEGVDVPGANRVYRLEVLRDGTVLAGTGIRGELLVSGDGGRTWTATTHVPGNTVLRGEGPDAEEVDTTATRVYSILELLDGRIVVGTGNTTGDVFVTADRGATWEALPETGRNNVVWGLAQASDGTLWLGTGSTIGDLLRSRGS